MKKKRKTKPRDRSAAAAAEEVAPSTLGNTLSRYAVAIFVVGLLAYLLLYFSAPAPSVLRVNSGAGEELTRIDLAMWLALVQMPDLWQSWTGGSIENVGIAGRLGVVSVAGLLLLSAAIVGWLILDVLALNRVLSRVEVFVFSLGVGLNVLSMLTLVVGLLGQLQNLLAYTMPLALLMLAAGLRFRRRVFSADDESLRTGRQTDSTEAKRDWLPAWVLWLAMPFVLVVFAGAMVPPKEFDVREYHLQAPKEWFQQGAITFLPHNVYANMPLGPQILSLPAMAIVPDESDRALNWWWGALVGKVVMAAYLPLTAFALLACGRRFCNTTVGVAAALLYVSIPWLAHVSIETYVDGALACNAFLAFYATALAVRWPATTVEEGDAESPTALAGLRAFLLAGFLAGAAVSCKYPGLLFVVFPLFMVVLFAGERKNVFSRERLLRAGVFLVAVLLGCGLWLGKNWAFTGNPTYPLLYGVFGGAARTPQQDDQWTNAHEVPRDASGRRYSLQQMGDAARRIAITSPWISPLLLPLAAVALLQRELRRKLLFAGGLFVFVLVTWFLFTHRIDRFWIPALPLLALIAGAGVITLDGPWWRRVVIALLFWGLVWNFMIVAGVLAPPKTLVRLDSLQQDARRVHPAHLWLNKSVPAGSTVLLVGDAQPFDLQVPAWYNTCFDNNLFEELIRGKSKEERLTALRARNVSHVFVQWSEVDRYRSPGNYGYTDYVTDDVFRELVAQGALGKPLGKKLDETGKPNRWVGEIYPVMDTDE